MDDMHKIFRDYDRAHGHLPQISDSVRGGRRFGSLKVGLAREIDSASERGYLVKGLMSPGELSAVVGPPKCGKSFLMLHLAYAVAQGRPIFGRRVKQAKTLYVACEGMAGIAQRVKALIRRYGVCDDFHVIAQPVDLLRPTGHMEDLISAAQGVGAGLIIIDTLNRVMAGGDENSPTDMGQMIANLNELAAASGAHVCVVHHGTKQSGGISPRGHSSFSGALDALVTVEPREDGTRTARIVFTKDDSTGDVHTFGLERVELGDDSDGDPITTLMVNEDAPPPVRTSWPERITNAERIALDCLDQTISADGQTATVGDAMEERPVASVDRWREQFFRCGDPDGTTEAKRKAFRRASQSLIAKGRVRLQDGFAWRPDRW